MRGDADHFNASIGSVAPDCFEHQEELLRKDGATSLVVDHPAACADTAIELGAIAARRQPPCGWSRFRFSVEGSHSVVSGAISVDCMSYKDARTKQSQDYRNRFDHLTHLDTLPYVYWADLVSGWLRRVRKMFFVRSARQKTCIRRIFYTPSEITRGRR
jgi:hypothetical protein